MIQLFVPGDPKPAPRPRKGKHGFYVPDVDRYWKERIYWSVCSLHEKKYVGPVVVYLGFILKAPKRVRLMPPNFTAPAFDTRGTDCDNLAKGPLDAMTKAGLWDDDRQVCELHVTKRYGQTPGAYITVRKLEEEDEYSVQRGKDAPRSDARGIAQASGR